MKAENVFRKVFSENCFMKTSLKLDMAQLFLPCIFFLSFSISFLCPRVNQMQHLFMVCRLRTLFGIAILSVKAQSPFVWLPELFHIIVSGVNF